jgi:hypothetical protein
MLNSSNTAFEAPPARSASTFGSDRARYAIDVAVRCLREREQDERVRALSQRAEALRAEIEGWRTEPPSLEMRDGMMQRLLSIHIEAAALARRP